MATIVQAEFDNSAAGGAVASFNGGFVSTPTSGNLVVLVYGARDADNNQCPSFTVSAPASGTWSNVDDGVYNLDVDLRADMEYHTFGAKYLTSDGSSIGTITVTPNQNVTSWWIGLIEINESGVSDWTLEVVVADGTGAGNASSIASGSTGTLSADAKVAIGLGTSRTAAEGLSVDDGFTSLVGVNSEAEIDAGSANWIAAWKSLAATTALNMTTTESGGSSRMASAVLVFAEASAGTDATINASVVTATGSIEAPSVTATSSATIEPTVVTAVVSTPSASLSSAISVSPAVVTALGSIESPDVSTGLDATINATVVTAEVVMDQASGTSSVVITPAVIEAVGSVEPATVTSSATISALVVEAPIEVLEATASTPTSATITPAVITAVGTVESVSASGSVTIGPAVLTLFAEVMGVSVSATALFTGSLDVTLQGITTGAEAIGRLNPSRGGSYFSALQAKTASKSEASTLEDLT